MDDADEGRKTIQLDASPAIAALPRDRLMLMMLTGPNPGAIQEVTGEMVLGRGIDLPARIDDRGMSRRHARIFKVGGTFHVEDLGSTNGTRVNGDLVEGQRDLRDGDRIQLGETTLLRVSLQDQHEAQAARKLYASATLDPLTQIFNRGHFEERLESEFAFTKRHKIPLTVLFFDLDKFKPVNDTFGHAAGDEVLKRTARTVAETIRTEDFLARYGGEEFVILARGIDREGGLLMGERIRVVIEAQRVSWEGKTIPVTASIGVATFDEMNDYATGDELVAAADRAAYRAKAGGRNQVCGPTVPPPVPPAGSGH